MCLCVCVCVWGGGGGGDVGEWQPRSQGFFPTHLLGSLEVGVGRVHRPCSDGLAHTEIRSWKMLALSTFMNQSVACPSHLILILFWVPDETLRS